MKILTDAGSFDLGLTEAAATIGIIDFSRRVTDDFGITTVVERGFARRMAVRCGLPFDRVDEVQRKLASLRATAATYVADDEIESLKVTGFYKDFSLDLAVPPLSFCTLTVEGLALTEPLTDSGADPAPDGQASTMRLLQPVAVTTAMLTASSVPETDYAAWAAGTTYGLGARVIKAATHRIFESLVAGNAGHDPDADTGEWLDVGPTNRWAMFDEALGTVTSRAGSIAVTINPGSVNALALIDVVGATARVQGTGYDQTQAVGAGTILFPDIPTTAGALTVTITGAGTVSVGTMLVGSIVGLGQTEASPTAGITDFSRKDADDFGEVTIVQRAWAKRVNANALISTAAVDDVVSRLVSVRARPALWIGDTGVDALIVYGFWKDFQIEVTENVSKLSLTIEGLSTAAPVSPLKINWADVVDSDPVNRPKPEDGATNGATIDPSATRGRLLGPDGLPLFPSEVLNTAISLKPDGQLVVAIEGVEQLLGKVKLPDLGAASAAQGAQLDRSVEQLAEAIARLSAGQKLVQDVFRDAGLFVDPENGTARLYAIERNNERLAQVAIELNAQLAKINLKASVDYVDERILAAGIDPSQIADLEAIIVRLTSAEFEIDGLAATIALKADATTLTALTGTVANISIELDALNASLTAKAEKTVVDGLGVRMNAAEETLSAMDGASIAQAVVASRRVPANADAAALSVINALTMADRAARTTQAAIALARQELTAKILSDVSAEALQRLQLGVQIGGVSAVLASERFARISGDDAVAGALNAYKASNNSAVANIETSLGAVVSQAGATAFSLSNFQTAVNGSLASVNDTLIAQSSAIGAVAGTVATLSTTVGGHTATLTAHASSIDGLKVRWGIELSSGGLVTGVVLNNDGQRGDMIVQVNRFGIASPSNPANYPFEVFDNVTYIKEAVIREATIGTLKIAGNAVTKRSFHENFGTFYGSGVDDWVTLIDATVVLPADADVLMDVEGQAILTTTGKAWTLRWMVDEVEVRRRGGAGALTEIPRCKAGKRVSGGSRRFRVQYWGQDAAIGIQAITADIDPSFR